MGSKFDNQTLAVKFNELADKFEKFYNENKTILNFSCTDVENHPCGTIACHGGFGLCILGNEKELRQNFVYGADLIAKYLGFEGTTQLETWAEENYYIWGNGYGWLS